jgi:hypothetical protein
MYLQFFIAILDLGDKKRSCRQEDIPNSKYIIDEFWSAEILASLSFRYVSFLRFAIFVNDLD